MSAGAVIESPTPNSFVVGVAIVEGDQPEAPEPEEVPVPAPEPEPDAAPEPEDEPTAP